MVKILVETETFNHEKLDVHFPFCYKYNDNYVYVTYDENTKKICQYYATRFIDTEYTFGKEEFDFLFRHHIGLIANGVFDIGDLHFEIISEDEFFEVYKFYLKQVKKLMP